MANEVEITVTSKDRTNFDASKKSVDDYGKGVEGAGDKADVAETRFQGMKDTVDGVATIMQGPGKAGIAGYIQGWADLAGGMANFVIPAIGMMKKTMITAARQAIVSAGQHVASVARMVGAWIVMGVQSLIAAGRIALAWLIAMGPIALVIAAVIGLVIIIVKNWDTIKRVISAGWDFVKRVTKAVWDAVWGFLKRTWELIKTAVTTYFNVYKTIITTVFNTVWGFIKTVWDRIRDFIRDTLARIREIVRDVLNRVKEIWTNIWNTIKDRVVTIFGTVITWLRDGVKRLRDIFKNAGTWLVEKGKGIIRGLWNGIKEIWKSTIDWFRDLPAKIMKALGISSPPPWAISTGKFVMKGILQGVLGGAGDLLGFAKSLPGKLGNLMAEAAQFVVGGFTGGGNLAGWANQAAAIAGVPGSWIPALIRRAMFESGGNPRAINLWDSNAKAGIPSMGLMQTIGPTFAAYAMPGLNDIWNPVHNMVAAIRYIIARYGTIFAIDPPVQGYREGSDYVPRTGLAFLHRGEGVLTAEENAARRRGGGTRVVLEIHSGGSRLDDLLIDVLSKSIRSRGGDVQVVLGS
jgi:phage-related protein